MTVDLTDVAKQVRGFYNSGPTTGIACAQVAFKCLTSPTDYPVNDGSFRNLKVILPPGSDRQRGAAGADALVDDLPDDGRRHDLQGAGARRSRTRSSPAITPISASSLLDGILSPTPASCSSRSFGPLGGGWGAKRGEDGVSATVCINDGDTHNSPNEQFEAKYPVLVESLSLMPGFRRPRPLSRRARRRDRGAGAHRFQRQYSESNARCVCPGDWRRPRRHRQRDADAARRRRRRRRAQCQGVSRQGQGRRCVYPAVGRRRRLRLSARSAGRGRAARRAPGLCFTGGCARLLRRDSGSARRSKSMSRRPNGSGASLWMCIASACRGRVKRRNASSARHSSQMPPGHLAIRCLLPSCCGRWHMPRGFEAVEIAP